MDDDAVRRSHLSVIVGADHPSMTARGAPE
jgi:hypothetical protein